MNRIIKFRGKTDDGEWIKGSLLTWPDGKAMVYDTLLADGSMGGNEVKPETVGQFTVLHDKNNRGIYEGDIVRWDKDGKLYIVEFRSGMFYASVEPCNQHVHGGFPLWCLCVEEQHCTIVGNRFDNSELLKLR